MAITQPLTRNTAQDSIAATTIDDEPLNNHDLVVDELAQMAVQRAGINNDTLQENRTVRWWLMLALTIMSALWLLYTVIIINCLVFDFPFVISGRFSDTIAIAFMTTSLATVLGLWHFGLRYFFTPNT